MALVEQWSTIERGLDPRWRDAQLALTVADPGRAERAAALLAPAGPGKREATIRFAATRSGAGVGPEAVRRMLRRIDAAGIGGTLELVAETERGPETVASRQSLATGWDAEVAQLPTDWSDLLCRLHLTSSDHVDVAALQLSPLNPLHARGSTTFEFRVARAFGYGASAGMTRRCFERVDDAGIPGEVSVVYALSDTHPVGTQGPVWHVDGRAV